MRGHPLFLNALAEFLGQWYDADVDPRWLLSTGGCSMGTEICARAHAKAGDYVVCETPTYYLCHQMFRERGLNLLEVPMQEDGMDMDALEKVLQEAAPGSVKLVHTVPVLHNPTSVTMSNDKRDRLMSLARQYDFMVIADEAYQLLHFAEAPVRPLVFHDDPAHPRCLSLGTFSKLIGPGMKVGWLHAHPTLLEPVCALALFQSGNNPVTFSSTALAQFVRNGALAAHIHYVCAELSRKCKLLVRQLQAIGLEPTVPQGGYFVWVRRKGADSKMTGRSGVGMSLYPPDQYKDYMRLCFAWLTDEQIVEGVRFLQ